MGKRKDRCRWSIFGRFILSFSLLLLRVLQASLKRFVRRCFTNGFLSFAPSVTNSFALPTMSSGGNDAAARATTTTAGASPAAAAAQHSGASSSSGSRHGAVDMTKYKRVVPEGNKGTTSAAQGEGGGGSSQPQDEVRLTTRTRIGALVTYALKLFEEQKLEKVCSSEGTWTILPLLCVSLSAYLSSLRLILLSLRHTPYNWFVVLPVLAFTGYSQGHGPVDIQGSHSG